MARRRRRTQGGGKLLRWVVLAALALGAVAFAREPDAAPEVAPRPAKPRAVRPVLPIDSPFFRSGPECEHAWRTRSRRAATAAPRIGTWNLRWFPRGTASGRDPERRTDVAWLACAIASLEVDLLAIQEVVQDVEGRAALLDLGERLDQLTGGQWRSELDDCSGSGRQHVGFLFDARRVALVGAQAIDALNPGRSGCDRSLRPDSARMHASPTAPTRT